MDVKQFRPKSLFQCKTENCLNKLKFKWDQIVFSPRVGRSKKKNPVSVTVGVEVGGHRSCSCA